MKLLSKIWYFIIAIIVLIIGYFLGTIILIIIFAIIVLMTVFYFITHILNLSLSAFTNKIAQLFIKFIFTVGLTVGTIILTKLVLEKWIIISSPLIKISIIYTISTIVFASIWYSIQVSIRRYKVINTKRQGQLNSKLIDYDTNAKDLNILDILFMLIIPALITFVFNFIVHFI
ncbi:MAG: hypothetical protein V1824_00045 [archaeon]